MNCLKSLFDKLSRKKLIPEAKVGSSNLKRCLSIIDLTALGIGSTLGLGIYVLAGEVAREDAGPAIVISFFIAAVASMFAGLCYAEFGSRVPRAGSAYIYSYVTVGEFIAFIIGWNLVLEYVIGTASVARGYSGYFDSLINGVMNDAFERTMPINVNFLADYADFFAFGITFLLALMLAFGVKESTKVNNVLTCVNLLVVVYAIICGLFKANIANWEIPDSVAPSYAGHGGFMPFGVEGLIAGAARCFYGFVGFDCIATTGEEAKNPQRNIPISIVLSLFIVFLAYSGIACVLTLMVPYYEQDVNVPIPYAFRKVGYPIAAWVVSIGALFGLSASLLGGMFPLPRVLYAMSSDGLIFRFLSKINRKFKTPFISTIIAGLFTASMALVFDTEQLTDMMSIGTLLAYTLVAASVLILRYQPDEPGTTINEGKSESEQSYLTPSSTFRQFFNLDRAPNPTVFSSTLVTWATLTMGLLLAGFNAVLIFTYDYISAGEPWAVALITVLGVTSILNVILIGLQPSSKKKIAFKVPWVPFIPALSFFVNTHLMLMLSYMTWIRFAVWMAIGFLIYFLYGMWCSSLEYARKGKTPPNYNSGMEQDTGDAGSQQEVVTEPDVAMGSVRAIEDQTSDLTSGFGTEANDEILMYTPHYTAFDDVSLDDNKPYVYDNGGVVVDEEKPDIDNETVSVNATQGTEPF